MTTQQFLILNLLILGFFALLFFWGKRGSKAPSNLRVTPPPANDVSTTKNLAGTEKKLVAGYQVETLKGSDCFFIYNGHSWDAYEVLGVPPGSSVEAIRAAFEKSIQKTDVGSHDFLKSALSTILSEMKAKGYRP